MLDGTIDKIGLLDDDKYLSVVKKNCENFDDTTLFSFVKNILLEDHDATLDNDKWKYLGEMSLDEDKNKIYCFSADITGLDISSIKMYNTNKILEITDSVSQAMFFRLFCSIYKKDLS